MKILILLGLLIPALTFAYTPTQQRQNRLRQNTVSAKDLSGMISVWAAHKQCIQNARKNHMTVSSTAKRKCDAKYDKAIQKLKTNRQH